MLGRVIGSSQSKWWLPLAPRRGKNSLGCPRGPFQRVLLAGMAVSGGGKRAGQRGKLAQLEETFLCVASPGTKNLATEQTGILEARQLPLGTEASLFPPCKTDTPAPPAERVGVCDR